jgi:predicted Ser/Thr protein kinase
MVPREHGLSRAAAAQLRLLVCAASSHHLPGAPAANVWAQLRLLCAACRSTANTSRRQHPYKPPGQGEQQHDQQQRPDQDHGCIGSALSSGGSAPPQPLPPPLPQPLPPLPCFTRWQLQLGRQLGQGAVATVVAGVWRGQPAAIKVLGTCRWQPPLAFMWEAKVLRLLQPLQGACVPQLWAHAYLGGASAYFMAMQLLRGPALDQLPRPLPPGVQAAALEALQRVHSLRVLHGDLQLRHLLLAAPAEGAAAGGGPPRVFLIDFDRARLDAPQGALAAEERRLLQLLQVG